MQDCRAHLASFPSPISFCTVQFFSRSDNSQDLLHSLLQASEEFCLLPSKVLDCRQVNLQNLHYFLKIMRAQQRPRAQLCTKHRQDLQLQCDCNWCAPISDWNAYPPEPGHACAHGRNCDRRIRTKPLKEISTRTCCMHHITSQAQSF